MSAIKNGDHVEVIAGTHAGKAGKVEDRNVSKTGAITITLRMADGDRVKTLAKNVHAAKKSAAKSPSSQTTIAQYVAAAPGPKAKAICKALRTLVDKSLPKLESKIWHRTPVWFDDGNPIVGIFARKNGSVKLMFWSGHSFNEPSLNKEGFKMATSEYMDAAQIKPAAVRRWCKLAKSIQWDYKNIVKRRGKLVKLGKW